MFTSQPQSVEVYQAGAWWAGELLGWRHDANGSCQVWVRVVLGGVEETAWTDLTSLRLPERHLAVAAEPARPRAYGPATQEMSVARHPSGRRARSVDADATTTAGLPMIRDLSLVPDLPSAGGRRTADETAQFASVGRRRAPDTAEFPAAGRRRAPETAESPSMSPSMSPSVGHRRAPEAPAAPVAPGQPNLAVPAGRHRAPAAPAAPTVPTVPADPGRHRTADTGMLPAVSASSRTARVTTTTGGSGPAVPRSTVRPESTGRAAAGWTAPEGLEPELLTRPMRLSDHVPHARRPRVDGALRGV